MDAPEKIHPEKDTTLCLIEAAGRRGWQTSCITQDSLFISNGVPGGTSREIDVELKEPEAVVRFGEQQNKALREFDVVLMRKDPPVDLEFIYSCHILSLAKRSGTTIVNDPDSLRLFNEKLLSLYFPDFVVPSLVSKNLEQIEAFIAKEKEAVVKPLNAMGGNSVFRLNTNDADAKAVIEKLSCKGSRSIMVQKLIPGWQKGDKRILIMGGRPVEQALMRVPPCGQFISNLAAGGQGQAAMLTARERLIADRAAPFLMQNGVLFAGIDVIGGCLTEINVTSPTGMREINRFFDLDLGMRFMELLEKEAGGRPC